jgi:hypothetical protein
MRVTLVLDLQEKDELRPEADLIPSTSLLLGAAGRTHRCTRGRGFQIPQYRRSSEGVNDLRLMMGSTDISTSARPALLDGRSSAAAPNHTGWKVYGCAAGIAASLEHRLFAGPDGTWE